MAIFTTALKLAKTKGTAGVRKTSKLNNVKPTANQLNEARRWDTRIKKVESLKNTSNTLLKSKNPVLDLLANKYNFEMRKNGKISKTLENQLRQSGLSQQEILNRTNMIKRRSKQMDKLAQNTNLKAVLDIIKSELDFKIKEEDDDANEQQKIKRIIKSYIRLLEEELLYKYKGTDTEQNDYDLSNIINFNDEINKVDDVERANFGMVNVISKMVNETVLDLEHNTSPDLLIEYEEEFIITRVDSLITTINDIKESINFILEG